MRDKTPHRVGYWVRRSVTKTNGLWSIFYKDNNGNGPRIVRINEYADGSWSCDQYNLNWGDKVNNLVVGGSFNECVNESVKFMETRQ